MRHHFLTLLAVAFPLSGLATPLLANDDATFSHCAPLFSQAAALRQSWDDYKAREPALISLQAKLERAKNEDLAEVRRLEDILEIMQNSDEVWAKYRHAYDRYETSHMNLNEFLSEASNLFERAKYYRDQSDLVYDRISGECPDTMSTSLLQAKCGQGNGGYTAICTAFGM